MYPHTDLRQTYLQNHFLSLSLSHSVSLSLALSLPRSLALSLTHARTHARAHTHKLTQETIYLASEQLLEMRDHQVSLKGVGMVEVNLVALMI